MMKELIEEIKGLNNNMKKLEKYVEKNKFTEDPVVLSVMKTQLEQMNDYFNILILRLGLQFGEAKCAEFLSTL